MPLDDVGLALLYASTSSQAICLSSLFSCYLFIYFILLKKKRKDAYASLDCGVDIDVDDARKLV